MNMLSLIVSAAGIIGTVAGGIYFVEDRYVTSSEFTTTIAANEKATHDYLLDLRIEQYENWQWRLEEQQEQKPLTAEEQRKLQRINNRLDKLYDMKEQ